MHRNRQKVNYEEVKESCQSRGAEVFSFTNVEEDFRKVIQQPFRWRFQEVLTNKDESQDEILIGIDILALLYPGRQLMGCESLII